MKRHSLAALVVGLAVLTPACATTRAYPDRPYPYERAYSAYDEGFSRGRMSGGWAAYRDLGKPYRRDFWSDAQYARATEGYRPQYGSRFDYSAGFRAGYERGYRERRSRERGSGRR
jgi:hypothetical protein